MDVFFNCQYTLTPKDCRSTHPSPESTCHFIMNECKNLLFLDYWISKKEILWTHEHKGKNDNVQLIRPSHLHNHLIYMINHIFICHALGIDRRTHIFPQYHQVWPMTHKHWFCRRMHVCFPCPPAFFFCLKIQSKYWAWIRKMSSMKPRAAGIQYKNK